MPHSPKIAKPLIAGALISEHLPDRDPHLKVHEEVRIDLAPISQAPSLTDVGAAENKVILDKSVPSSWLSRRRTVDKFQRTMKEHMRER